MKDVFIIPEGAPGALAELERRKFTAEEGVSCVVFSSARSLIFLLGSPHFVEWYVS